VNAVYAGFVDELEATFDTVKQDAIARYLHEAALAFQHRTEPETTAITEFTEAASAAAASIDADIWIGTPRGTMGTRRP